MENLNNSEEGHTAACQGNKLLTGAFFNTHLNRIIYMLDVHMIFLCSVYTSPLSLCILLFSVGVPSVRP